MANKQSSNKSIYFDIYDNCLDERVKEDPALWIRKIILKDTAPVKTLEEIVAGLKSKDSLLHTLSEQGALGSILDEKISALCKQMYGSLSVIETHEASCWALTSLFDEQMKAGNIDEVLSDKNTYIYMAAIIFSDGEIKLYAESGVEYEEQQVIEDLVHYTMSVKAKKHLEAYEYQID